MPATLQDQYDLYNTALVTHYDQMLENVNALITQSEEPDSEAICERLGYLGALQTAIIYFDVLSTDGHPIKNPLPDMPEAVFSVIQQETVRTIFASLDTPRRQAEIRGCAEEMYSDISDEALARGIKVLKDVLPSWTLDDLKRENGLTNVPLKAAPATGRGARPHATP